MQINKKNICTVYYITHVSITICIANCSYRVEHDALPGPRLSLQLQKQLTRRTNHDYFLLIIITIKVYMQFLENSSFMRG